MAENLSHDRNESEAERIRPRGIAMHRFGAEDLTLASLSESELSIAGYLLSGLVHRQIASLLGVDNDEVAARVFALLGKLQVTSRDELVQACRKLVA